MKATKVTTYEPDNAIRHGVGGMFREMGREVTENRWLIRQMFMREVKSSYQQSALGILWVLLTPAIAIGTFVLLNSTGIIDTGTSAPFVLFAIVGMLFFQVFSMGINSGTSSLVNAGGMISKINFPRETLVFAAVGKVLIDFVVMVGAVAVIYAYYFIDRGIAPTLWIAALPLLFLPVLALTLGLSFIFSILNAIFRDIQRVVPVAVTFLMFLTPVLWEPSGELSAFVKYNPLFYLVCVPRQLIMDGSTPYALEFLVSAGIAAATLAVCWVVFHLAESRIAERI